MKTKRYFWLVFILVCLVSASNALPVSGNVSPTSAESPTQPEAAAALTSLAGYETDPALAYDPQLDHFLLAYGYATPPPDFQYSIQAQFVDANGSPINPALMLSTDDSTVREHPEAAYNINEEEFLVIWDLRFSSTDHDIYARRVTSVGAVVGSEIAVDLSGSDDSLPDLAYDPESEEYLAVWERYNVDQSEIYGLRLDASGAPLGSGFYIADDSIDESGAAVAYNATSGEFLVVWHVQSAADNYDIYGQRVSSGGGLSGGVIQISSAAGNQMHPQLAYNSDADQFLVVWQDERVDGDIYGQRVNGAGGLVGGNFAIADQGAIPPHSPQVAFQPNQVEYMVAWSMNVARRGCQCLPAARAARMAPCPKGERLVSGLSSFEERPSIAAGGGLSYLLAWQDDRDIAQWDNIYGEVVRLNRMQGKVFEGPAGDESTPLEGATVGLYGSNNAGIPGTLLESVVTDASGWFGMVAPLGFEYYNLIETNPATYDSVAAISPGGSVLSMDWIQFPIPLEGKDLSGNRFWDQPPSLAGCGGVFYPSADSSVYQDEPSTPHGNDPFLQVKRGRSPSTGQSRAFLTFDLGDRIPAEAIIHSAELELKVSQAPDPAELQLQIASLPHDWDEATLTWNNQPATGYAFETKSYRPIWSDTDPVILRVDVSTLVNLWATGVMTPTSLAILPGNQPGRFQFLTAGSRRIPRPG